MLPGVYNKFLTKEASTSYNRIMPRKCIRRLVKSLLCHVLEIIHLTTYPLNGTDFSNIVIRALLWYTKYILRWDISVVFRLFHMVFIEYILQVKVGNPASLHLSRWNLLWFSMGRSIVLITSDRTIFWIFLNVVTLLASLIKGTNFLCV